MTGGLAVDTPKRTEDFREGPVNRPKAGPIVWLFILVGIPIWALWYGSK
jgi:hypothetical protein